jgi:hypothetical protein
MANNDNKRKILSIIPSLRMYVGRFNMKIAESVCHNSNINGNNGVMANNVISIIYVEHVWPYEKLINSVGRIFNRSNMYENVCSAKNSVSEKQQ